MADTPSDVTKDKDKNKLTKTEYLRIIGFWGAIFALVLFTYQLGQWNALNIIQHIHTFCGNNTIVDVGIFGDTAIAKNLSLITAIP